MTNTLKRGLSRMGKRQCLARNQARLLHRGTPTVGFSRRNAARGSDVKTGFGSWSSWLGGRGNAARARSGPVEMVLVESTLPEPGAVELAAASSRCAPTYEKRWWRIATRGAQQVERCSKRALGRAQGMLYLRGQ